MENPFIKKEKKKKIENLKSYIYKRTGMEAISESNKDIKSNLSILKERLNPKKKENISFEEAMIKNNCNEERLNKIYSNFKTAFYINLIIFLLYLFVLIKNILSDNLTINFILISISFIFLFCAILFNISFKAYQLKNRKFYSVKQWFKNVKEWIPFGKVYSIEEVKKKNKKSKQLFL